MSEWKVTFKKGVASFRAGKYEDAVAHFSKALDAGGEGSTIYDARAAVYQKMGKVKEALRDSKAMIDIQPNRWQGYARSARLFLQIRKYDAAGRMADLALERIPPDQAARRNEMLVLQNEIANAREMAAEENAKLASLRAYHFGKLPVEIAHSTFSMILAEDPAYVVVLGQVCKNWRTTVLNTPSFWDTLIVGDNHPKRKILSWKQRAKGRIRELVLLRDFTDTPSVLDELQALSAKSMRVVRLHDFPMGGLPLHIPRMLVNAVQASFGGIPLSCQASFRGDIHWHEQVPSFHCKSLELRTTYKVEWAILSDKLKHLQSCSLLTCLGKDDFPHLVWLLQNNPSLQQLALTSFFPTSFEFSPDRPRPAEVILPNLTDLQMTDASAEHILPLLSVPSLRTVVFSSCSRRFNICLTHLAQHMSAGLMSLTIQGCVVDPSLLLEVLRAARSLETLKLNNLGMKDTSQVLEALARPLGDAPDDSPQPPVYCPALRHLDCSNNEDVLGGPLVRLVKLRITRSQPSSDSASSVDGEDASPGTFPVQPLQSLIINGCTNVDATVLPWLRQNVPVVSCVYMSKRNAGWKR